MVIIPIVIFILGLIIGSFLNVVILRLNTGRSIVKGRSKCLRCDQPLAWYEMIPVFSYLGLRGRCANCKQHISFQYPIVELTTAIVFTILYSTVFATYGFTLVGILIWLFSATVAALLIVIFVYDIRHMIIPDMIVYLFIICSLIAIAWSIFTVPGFNPGMALVNGVLVALPFFLWWLLSKGQAMGFGDVKLALGIGWLLGLLPGLSVDIFAIWIGGLVGVVLLAINRKYHLRSQIPFAPFLIVATAIVAIGGVTILSILTI